jgi:Domain of Unknown Function (DUF1080)
MFRFAVMCAALLCSLAAGAQKSRTQLPSPESLQTINASARQVNYRGHKAIELLPAVGMEKADQGMLAILPNTDFKDGTIELEVSGTARAGSSPIMRGFIGVAFRVQGEGESLKFECFYVRTLNARSNDQLQRNHSLQYVSEPDFGWKRLRTESPGVYESYSDLVPGEWMKLKIVVSGAKAQLYINGANQPSLIVNDLKQGDSHGKIALWSHTSTEGYFSNLVVK